MPIPTRPVFAPSIPSQYAKPVTPTPEKWSQTPLPPRPTMPPKLTRTVTTTNEQGETVERERDVQLLERDLRIIHHLAENGIATRKILAVLSGATEANVGQKMDALRKRLTVLIAAGVLSVQGNDQGANTIYALTDMGRKFYLYSDIDEKFIPAFDETTMLNISSVIARISAPSSSPLLININPGETSIGFPVLTRARISADTYQMMNKRGSSNLQQQLSDRRTLGQVHGFPVIGTGWSLDDFTEEQSAAVSRIHHQGFQSTYGDKQHVMTGSLYQVLDEYGNAQDMLDFVIPLPAIRYEGRNYLSAMACMVEIDLQANEVYQRKFSMIANSNAGFTKVVCFVPDTQTGITKAIRENWNLSISRGFIAESSKEDLLIIPYTPVGTPNTPVNMASTDKQVPVKHFGRG